MNNQTTPIKLDDLIQTIVDKINSGEITRTDDLQNAKDYGDHILTTQGILYYTQERWDGGRWMSKLRTKEILRRTKDTGTQITPRNYSDDRGPITPPEPTTQTTTKPTTRKKTLRDLTTTN